MRLRTRWSWFLLLLPVLSAVLLWFGWPAEAPRLAPSSVAAEAAPEPPVAKPASPPAASPRIEPPEEMRAVYLTSWSAGLRRRIDYVLELRKTSGLNAVIFDIKDYSGYIAYRSGVPDAARYGAIRVAIRDLDSVIRRLHAEGIYVIARITVFQDPILARARPEWAVHSREKLDAEGGELSASTLWLDRKGLAWIDPAAEPAWDYTIEIAREAIARGFDELNFDYIRFPSDGDLKDMVFPAWNGAGPRHAAIRRFFRHLREGLPGAIISADLFGLATINKDDLGIGQVIEDAFAEFDYVCPMVYPSHYAKSFLGFANPAEYPYEVVHYSMTRAVTRLQHLCEAGGETQSDDGPPRRAKLRPWLQDFHLGAQYDPDMVNAQIEATRDALGDDYAGYMLWSPSNVYTRPALE